MGKGGAIFNFRGTARLWRMWGDPQDACKAYCSLEIAKIVVAFKLEFSFIYFFNITSVLDFRLNLWWSSIIRYPIIQKIHDKPRAGTGTNELGQEGQRQMLEPNLRNLISNFIILHNLMENSSRKV